MWLRIEAVGGLLLMRLRIIWIHKIERNSRLADGFLASQERLCSVELVTEGKEMYRSVHLMYRPTENARYLRLHYW